ncbi:MAG TPA: MFS transporter, partial [Phototrophicaceae bacterium]|nr:MFS transporter [Phototrophicaceae bacterium]
GAMLLAFIMAFLVQFHLVLLPHVFLLAAGLGIVNALDLPAQQTFLGDLTGMGEVRKAINLNATMLQFSRVVGPVIAGFLIAKIGNAPAFWLNGISFLAVILSLMAVRSQQVRGNVSHAHPLTQIMDAFRFLRTQPRLQDMFFFMGLMTLFYWSIVLNLLPIVATKVLGGDASTLGTLQAASGAGAMIGILLIVPLAHTARRSGLVLGGSALWVGVWLSGFAASHVLWLSFLTLFAATLAAPVIFTMAIGTTQVMAPPDMRARLISLFTMISFGLQPLAALAVGTLAEWFGVLPIIQFNAIMIILGAGAILLVRTELRHWTVMQTPAVVTAELSGD